MSLDTCITKLRSSYVRIATAVASVFLFVGFIATAHAGSIQNTDKSTTYALPNAHFGGEQWPLATGAGNDPYASHVAVTSIVVNVKNNTNGCHAVLRVVNKSLSTFTSDNRVTLTNTLTDYTFTFTNPNIYVDEIYRIYVNSVAGGGNPCTLSANYDLTFGAGNNSYSYADGFDITGSTTSTNDIYFVVNGGRSTVSFVGTPLSTCNFSNWKIQRQFSSSDTAACLSPTTTPTNCSLGVAWNVNANSTSTYLYNVNSGQSASCNGATGQCYIPNNFTFVSGTVYDARAYICNTNNSGDCYLGVGYNSNILAYSDNWEFIANGLDTCTTTYYSQNEIPAPQGATSTQYQTLVAMATGQCDSYNDHSVLGGVAWGLCKVLVSLFVPSQDALNNFSNLRAQVSAKPPFGYVSVFTTQIGNLTSATSTTSTLNSVTSTSAMQLSSIANISIISTIKTAFGWFLWFVFVWYVYSRFKNFSLHG